MTEFKFKLRPIHKPEPDEIDPRAQLEEELAGLLDVKLPREFYHFEEWHELLQKLVKIKRKLSKL